MIERIHLNILREIEDRGSVTAAAQALNLTQPALTHAIKKLESQLGTSLWIKKGRNIRLTHSGLYLLAQAKRLLPQLNRIDETLKTYAKGETGLLRIGMECHPCYQWLLKIVARFLEHFPKADLDVKQKFQFGGMAALFNHDIDLLVTPDPIVREGIVFTPVFSYEQVLVTSDRHPLAKHQTVRAKDLLDQVLYTYPVDVERLDIYSQFLLPAGCLPKTRKTVEATEIMLEYVAANRGVTVLPRWLVDHYQHDLPLKPLRIGRDGIFKQIHLGARVEDSHNSLVPGFIELAQKFGQIKFTSSRIS
ncbi:MAG: LysR family transcriptional regulator [Limnobacter sp.]|nr:LysR family transcriptional regulator [Limnobacter sp.]